MGLYQSQVVAFARYATAQVAHHQQVLALHQVDGTGCCRRCGRIWPCDHTRYSLQMADHFSQWALDEEPKQASPDPDLVRPYTTPTPSN
jgi:hypothetical protein